MTTVQGLSNRETQLALAVIAIGVVGFLLILAWSIWRDPQAVARRQYRREAARRRRRRARALRRLAANLRQLDHPTDRSTR